MPQLTLLVFYHCLKHWTSEELIIVLKALFLERGDFKTNFLLTLISSKASFFCFQGTTISQPDLAFPRNIIVVQPSLMTSHVVCVTYVKKVGFGVHVIIWNCSHEHHSFIISWLLMRKISPFTLFILCNSFSFLIPTIIDQVSPFLTIVTLHTLLVDLCLMIWSTSSSLEGFK